MIRYRNHRGGLEESMYTTRFFNNGEEVKAHIRAALAGWEVDTAVIEATFYARDKRIDWPESWIVTIPNYGVVGWTDGPIDGEMVFEDDEAIADEA